jgi:hypothetical protein
LKPAASLLGLLAAATLLAGCASNGPVESRPSPTLPPAPGQAPTTPRPPVISEPQRPVQAQPPPVISVPAPPPPRPVVTSYPDEREGRALVAGYLPTLLKDRDGWAADIFTAFAALRLPPTPDNICAAIAVTEQESTFQADPVVAGLSRIVWKEIDTRRERLHLPKLLVDAALLKTSPDGRSYKARIDSPAHRKADECPVRRHDLGAAGGQNPARRLQPGADRGPDAGQRGLCRRACKGKVLSVSAAGQRARRSVHPPWRALLRHRHPARLPGTLYPAPVPLCGLQRRPLQQSQCRLPGGRARLTSRPLALDGDLLRYTDGVPAAEPSATLSALQSLAGQLGLSRAEMQRDLRLEKTARFSSTPLDTIVVPTAAAEPPGLLTALSEQRRRFRDVKVSQILPIGRYGYFDPATAEHVRHVAYFFGPATRGGGQAGWIDYSASNFSEMPELIRRGLKPADVVFASASPMDGHGYFSLGLAADYTLAAISRARVVVLEVNPNVPFTNGACLVHLSQVTALVEREAPVARWACRRSARCRRPSASTWPT